MIAVEIGDNVFISVIGSSLIEIPSYIFLLIFADKFGRKPLAVLMLSLMGVACIAAAFISGTAQVALAFTGNVCINESKYYHINAQYVEICTSNLFAYVQ